jgi:hypothetical protein
VLDLRHFMAVVRCSVFGVRCSLFGVRGHTQGGVTLKVVLYKQTPVRKERERERERRRRKRRRRGGGEIKKVRMQYETGHLASDGVVDVWRPAHDHV